MSVRTDTYWLAYLSTSIVVALDHDKPKPFLQNELRNFMRDRPHSDPVAAELRKTLAERKR